jgi:type IV pilus assembly protein PilC
MGNRLPPTLSTTQNSSSQQKKASKNLFVISSDKVSLSDKIDFARSLAVLTNAHIPLADSLRTIRQQTGNTYAKNIVRDLHSDIQQGISLAGAMKKHPDMFDNFFINMVKIGESAGILGNVLERLAQNLERLHQIKKNLQSAMMYPAIVSIVAILALLFLLTVIVPTFAKMYENFGSELPYLTSIILDVSNFIQSNISYILIGIVIFIIGLKWLIQNEKFLHWRDQVLLKIPVLGTFITKSLTAQYCQILGTLLSNGITLVDSLILLKNTFSNRIFKDATGDFQQAVQQGYKLSDQMRESELFPVMVIQMISVGEESGSLDEMLDHIAKIYAEDVETEIDGLSSILEPILIVVIGIILGAVIIALYMPIFQLMNVVK